MYQFNNNKGFGVEIEFIRPNEITMQQVANKVEDALIQVGGGCNLESYNHITRPQWKLVTDSSVQGQTGYRGNNELVSPILRGYNGKKQLQIVLDTLITLGCKVNVSCGIHVHHDVTDTMVGNEQWYQYYYEAYHNPIIVGPDSYSVGDQFRISIYW